MSTNSTDLKNALRRISPVGLALAPIGLLFGILAAQANWSALDVFLLSIIGFTGSGQFIFLQFSSQGLANVGILVIFFVILSVNLRYIPMSLSASQPLQTPIVNKFWLAHCLADESYATEHKEDDIKTRTVIRICILLSWSVSTVIGVWLAAALPKSITHVLAGLTFPISAILAALSFVHIRNHIIHKLDQKKIHLIQVILCFVSTLLLMLFFGKKYFWLPSIATSYLLLTPRFFRKKYV